MSMTTIKIESPGEVQVETVTEWVPAVGDTVVLKSGSPLMTIEYIDNANVAKCVYSLRHTGGIYSTCVDVNALKQASDTPFTFQDC